MIVARRWRWTLAAAITCGFVVANLAWRAAGTQRFPSNWSIDVYGWARDTQAWVQRNRTDHWLFRFLLRPIGDSILKVYGWLVDILTWPSPWVLMAVAALGVAWSRRWYSAAFCAAALWYIDRVDLWESGMETLALMLLCIGACVVIGFPLGVWAGVRPTVLRRISPVLDALQAIPATIYFVPAVLLFGIKQVPAAIATILFGIAPLIRITALGIQQVPQASVEAGEMFGSSAWQLLTKVRLPQARTAILTGLNQTINMNLGMVVIGALVGAGGLGDEVVQTLKRRSPGEGFVAGMAIVMLAMVLDRCCQALGGRAPRPTRPWRHLALCAGGAAVTFAALWLFGRASTVDWIDRSLLDLRDSRGSQFEAVSDFFVGEIFVRIRGWLQDSIAWPVIVGATMAIAWFARGWRLALFALVGLAAVGLTGTWATSLDTLTQIVIAVAITCVLAFPVGVALARSRWLDRAVAPVLDFLQTLPSMIYGIPFVMLFRIGAMPGLLATVLYALPPGIRLVSLALRGVDERVIEASRMFGAAPAQTMLGVRVPLATRGLGLALNQVIMMALSMIIITGQIGGGGLGFLAVSALTKPDMGEGAQVAIAMLVMAVLLDRITQGIATRTPREAAAVGTPL